MADHQGKPVSFDTARVLKHIREFLDRAERFNGSAVAAQMSITQSALSFHLYQLRSAGYIKRLSPGVYAWDNKPVGPVPTRAKRQARSVTKLSNAETAAAREKARAAHRPDTLVPMHRLMAGNGRVAKLRPVT
jgi:hypothetical protein